MKIKILKRIVLVTIIAISTIFFSNIQKVGAYSAQFDDFSSVSELNEKYSFGTMFWTENTEIIPISAPYVSTTDADKENGFYKSYGAEADQYLQLKITNCAIDEDNDLCDVMLTIKPIQNFTGFTDKTRWTQYLYTGDDLINFEKSGKVLNNVLSIHKTLKIEDQTISTSKPGDLMFFDLDTVFEESKLTLEYYKAGTQNKAKINGVSGFVSNLNVPASMHYQSNLDFSEFFCDANESVVPAYDSKIYYDTTSPKIEKSEKWGGIYVKGSYLSGNWKVNSCFILEDENAKFEMFYGGTACGITFGFFSPYQYSTPNPDITVDKTMVYENEEYNVKVSQYVPNNYYANLIKFVSSGSFYTSFKITGNINGYDYKSFDLSKVKVYNSRNNDVSNMFNIEQEGSIITATLKSEYLESIEFYNNVYFLNIPLKYLKNDDNKKQEDFTVEGSSNISGEEKNAGNVKTMVKIDIPIKKVWNDRGNIFHSRPDKIIVDILKK